MKPRDFFAGWAWWELIVVACCAVSIAWRVDILWQFLTW